MLVAALLTTLFVHNDGGGRFPDYVERYNAHDRIVISGECASSCVIYMTHPGACAMPGAVLGMHYGKRRGQWSEVATRNFLRRLPNSVQQVWAIEKLRKGSRTKDFIWVMARDVMRECE